MLLLILIVYITGFSGCQQKLKTKKPKKKKTNDFQFSRLRSLRPEGHGSWLSGGHAGYETCRRGRPGPEASPRGGSVSWEGRSLVPAFSPYYFPRIGERRMRGGLWPTGRQGRNVSNNVIQARTGACPGHGGSPGSELGVPCPRPGVFEGPHLQTCVQ